MPIYDFKCPHCQHEFESLMVPHEPIKCPKCEEDGAERQFSKPGTYFINGDNSASTRPKKA